MNGLIRKSIEHIALATTPWIAFVSCDFNVTGFSLDVDIFTLARDRGAVAAVGIIFLSDRFFRSNKPPPTYSCYTLSGLMLAS